MGKIVFFNIGWMDNYQGISGGDHIQGGGAFVHQNDVGVEMFNFREHQGKVYGFVETKVTDNRDGQAYLPDGRLATGRQRRTICINKLGASNRDESINDVTVIWTAPNPSGGTYIVGWYRHATVFRRHQVSKNLTYRIYNGMVCDYNVVADFKNTVLLHPSERIFEIPRGKGGMGQSNVWYANQPCHASFVEKVKAYIEQEDKIICAR